MLCFQPRCFNFWTAWSISKFCSLSRSSSCEIQNSSFWLCNLQKSPFSSQRRAWGGNYLILGALCSHEASHSDFKKSLKCLKPPCWTEWNLLHKHELSVISILVCRKQNNPLVLSYFMQVVPECAWKNWNVGGHHASAVGGVLQGVIGTNWRRNLPSLGPSICLGDVSLLSCWQRCSCWEFCQWHRALNCIGWAAQSCPVIVSGSY